jgi:hypothetical protein
MSEMFGHNAMRPDHPDFWRLSEILLGLDAGMEEATSKDAYWEKSVEIHVDRPSMVYMAMQRALRALNVRSKADLATVQQQVATLATMWCEGFIVGAEFKERGGKQ